MSKRIKKIENLKTELGKIMAKNEKLVYRYQQISAQIHALEEAEAQEARRRSVQSVTNTTVCISDPSGKAAQTGRTKVVGFGVSVDGERTAPKADNT